MEQLFNYILFRFGGIIDVGSNTVVIDWDWYAGMEAGYQARGLVNFYYIVDGWIHNISGCEYLRFKNLPVNYKWNGTTYVLYGGDI